MSATSKILEDLQQNVTFYRSNIRQFHAKKNVLDGLNNIDDKDKSVLFQIKEAESYKDIYEENADKSYREAHRLFDRHKDDFDASELSEAKALMDKLE